jgi:hypothetical protein
VPGGGGGAPGGAVGGGAEVYPPRTGIWCPLPYIHCMNAMSYSPCDAGCLAAVSCLQVASSDQN